MIQSLPIYDLEPDLLAALRAKRRVLLSAPPGSGKSTQVPQMLLRHGLLENGQAVVLQPRRIAARMLAARVAEERGTPLGGEIGYQVRFENKTGPATRVRFVTEGLLLRQMIADPRLAGVAALVFDEFHERHLEADITLARALDLQEKERPDLLVIVMSATLDAEGLEKYLQPCVRLSTEGRVHAVRIEQAASAPETPVWEAAADAVAGWVKRGGEGDALVFMPGAFEIARTIEAVEARPEARGRLVLPLHGELSPADQDAAVGRAARPKVIVSTNVAETSLTIDGVRLVVDSGLARIARHDPRRSLNTLFVEKISRASADQRAGRAGRTAPGTCVRLWDAKDHAARAAREEPEVKRVDLAEAVLLLKAAGAGDLRKFRWLDAPEEKALGRAEELLHDLGALQENAITPLGRRMLAFPVHPRYSRMLIAAGDLGCVRQAALAAALTQGRDILVRHADHDAAERRDDLIGDRDSSDFPLLMRAWELAAENRFGVDACRRAGIHAQSARQVGPAYEVFLRVAERQGLDTKAPDAPPEVLRKCLLIGFPDRVARRVDSATLRCEMVHGRKGVLGRESAVRRAPLFVAAEVREIEGKGKALNTIFSLATSIEAAWLEEFFPGDISRKVLARFDAESKRVVAEERTRFHDLLMATRVVGPPPDEAARILAEEVVAGRLALKSWDAATEQGILRVNFLAKACPELEITAIGPEERRAMIGKLCEGAVSWNDIKDRPVAGVVRGAVEADKRALVEKHAPERVTLSNGKSPKLVYEIDKAPHLAMRIQELYGVTKVPAIAMGRVTPHVEILAPNNRPVQVTQDLAGFWKEHYPKVKKEMQRKYPKHVWK